MNTMYYKEYDGPCVEDEGEPLPWKTEAEWLAHCAAAGISPNPPF